jgi:hypothetical protein
MWMLSYVFQHNRSIHTLEFRGMVCVSLLQPTSKQLSADPRLQDVDVDNLLAALKVSKIKTLILKGIAFGLVKW